MSVQIRERVIGSARGIWIEDDSPHWWLLRSDVASYEGAEQHDKLTEPWTRPPTRVLDAMVQRTWAGELFEVQQADGSRRAHGESGREW